MDADLAEAKAKWEKARAEYEAFLAAKAKG